MRITTVVVPLLVSVGFAATAHAQAVDVAPVAPVAAPQLADVSGTYTSTWGAMTLRQSGAHVTVGRNGSGLFAERVLVDGEHFVVRQQAEREVIELVQRAAEQQGRRDEAPDAENYEERKRRSAF